MKPKLQCWVDSAVLHYTTAGQATLPNGHSGEEADGVVSLTAESGAGDGERKEGEESGKTDESGEEVVMIQDTGFNIQIVAPSVEPFDLPVS